MPISGFLLRTDRVRSPRTGESYDFYVLESSSWVNVIPLTADGEVVMVRQYRHGIRENTLEIPGGLVENSDSPEEAASRELLEETGYAATEIVPLGWVHPNPAIQNNRCYSFLAMDVTPAGQQTLDDREDIEVVIRPLADIPSLIRTGTISHALVVAAFHQYFLKYDIPKR